MQAVISKILHFPARTLLEQVDHWQSFLALVNMIMFCTGIPGHYPVNETTSSLTLTFWYTLQVRHGHINHPCIATILFYSSGEFSA